MTAYIHHVPGRLRVRSAQIKGNPHRAAAVQRTLLQTAGLLSAEVSTTTGSVVIHYDPHRVDSDTLLGALKDAGCAAPDANLNASTGRMESTAANELYPWGLIGKAVAGVVLEKLVEHSATALIGAII
jgi:hypothetical protein